MYCPACESEHVAGIQHCPVCDVALAAEPIRPDTGVSEDESIVTAVEVWNPAEAEIVCSLLRGHGIPCLLKAENQYAVDATYTVGPLARRCILVRASDLDRAREILQAAPLPDLPLEG
jgi:hypothetical protein